MVGKKIRVFWPLDKTWYDGHVKSFNKLTGKHLIQYEDAEEEVLDLEKEKIEWVKEEAPRKLRRLKRVSRSPVPETEIVRDSVNVDDDDSEDEDWGKGVGKHVDNDDSEEVELEEEIEENEKSVAKRSGKRSSSSVGSGKRKKVDVEKLCCSKKFRFDGDGEGDGQKGGSLVTPTSKIRYSTALTTEGN